MQISRVVVRNYRALANVDIDVCEDLCCIIGENNTGKSALLRAIQICLDVSLPSSYRALIREDINSAVDVSHPNQVLVGVELSNFQGKVNEEALVSTWKIGADKARIFYRFRPKPSIRERLNNGEVPPGTLTLEDYSWDLRAGGDPALDLADLEWDDEDVGEPVRFADLQSYLVVALAALRDVEADLRNARVSPLVRLIEAFDVLPPEQKALIDILNDANAKIEGAKTISDVADAIDKSFKNVSGPAFEMGVGLGLASATFQSIIRNLKVLLSDATLMKFEPSRNGLGMNNILYIAILIEYLQKRIARASTAGQLLLIEEPEAHLHPQLQMALLIALRKFGIQVILTTHSPQVTSQAPFKTFVSLTRKADLTVAAGTLADNSALSEPEISDLERYLDATKSNLLFARRVMLVEGPAELFLIPAMVEAVKGIQLERSGISIIAIYGVHFDVYAKLFAEGSLEKRCAIVADADLLPSDADDNFDVDEHAPDLAALRSPLVEVFAGATTFERELVSVDTLPMFIAATKDLGATKTTKSLEEIYTELTDILSDADPDHLLEDGGSIVLSAAKRFGKARFAQVAARHAHLCTALPSYIENAVDWLSE
ncbi:ATP-dependent nuclease [Mesorhizobium salmacidum]|uniref:AAA family ATPase n=1 Tax=Mesorhizobium salmacidum TaxID=3015171 RepID=A0ABU8KPM2_9HYPH